jgi:hypothetical protein
MSWKLHRASKAYERDPELRPYGPLPNDGQISLIRFPISLLVDELAEGIYPVAISLSQEAVFSPLN